MTCSKFLRCLTKIDYKLYQYCLLIVGNSFKLYCIQTLLTIKNAYRLIAVFILYLSHFYKTINMNEFQSVFEI